MDSGADYLMLSLEGVVGIASKWHLISMLSSLNILLLAGYTTVPPVMS